MTSNRRPSFDVLQVVPWLMTFTLIGYLIERRASIDFPWWLVVVVAAIGATLCWRLTRTPEPAPDRARPRSFPLGAFVAVVVTFAVGVSARNGFRLEPRGGSADLAHHAAIVNALANANANGFPEELPSLRYYPIGAHLPAALFMRISGWNALTTTYLFSQIAVIGLVASIAFVALQLEPRNRWITAAMLVWVGAAWRPIFLDSVMSNFFYSQEVALALAVGTIGFGIAWWRGSSTAIAWTVLCGTGVAAAYPTYVVLVLPVMALCVVRTTPRLARDLVVRSGVILTPALAAAALSTYPGPGADTVAHEGVIAAIGASSYFGGPALLFAALLGTIAAFGRRDAGAPSSPWGYLFGGAWSLVRLWFVLTVVFLAGNWALFRLGVYGSRYNSVKSIYPVAAGLAVFLAVFVGNVVPDRWLDGVPDRLRASAVCVAVLVVGLWADLFSPVGATFSADQIRAVEFARDSGEPFAPIQPTAFDYILSVALVPLDPGGSVAPAILANDPAPFERARLYVSLQPSTVDPTAVDGAPLTPICQFGSATVYARAGSPAMGLAERCPTGD